MLEETTRLNMDLQSQVLDEFDELKVIMADMKQRVQKNLEKNQGILPVGYKRLDNSMIHLGQDVWITIPQYDSISCLSNTSAKFVKNLAIAVFGTTTLKGSSVTGVVSNRVKNKSLNAIARPKLDPTKLLAIKDALGLWLRTEKRLDEVSIDLELTRVGSYISHKIFELLRKDKKQDANLHVNLVSEVDYQQDIEPQPRAQDSDDNRGQESDDGNGQNSNNSRGQENTEDDGQESDNSRGTEESHNDQESDDHESDQENLDGQESENSFGQNNNKIIKQEGINDDDGEGTGYDDDQKPDDSRDKDNGDESSQDSNDDHHQETGDDEKES